MSIFRLPIHSILIVFLFVVACKTKTTSEEKKKEVSTDTSPSEANDTETPDPNSYDEYSYASASYAELKSNLPPFDLNQDLSTKTLEELRILRNTIPARYGYLFEKSDLRYYFYNTSWYHELMKARWYGHCEDSGLNPAPPIEYTEEETAFMEKVLKLENEKLKQNYITKDGLKYANVNNIINGWQFNNLSGEFKNALAKNGFAIVPNKNTQLFHLYEQNDYSATQNFVSTDLYLQLSHIHFSFMLRQLEEEEFVPILGELLSGFLQKVSDLQNQAAADPLKDAIQFNAAFYSIPLSILGAQNVKVPAPYQKQVMDELNNITQQVATQSVLLPAYKKFEFPYDLFKPRGHYTRTDSLKRYFKAMQWLQLAPYCISDNKDLERAVVAAYILNKGMSKSGKSLKSLYLAMLEPTSFLVGQPDNVSLIDICSLLEHKNLTLAELVKPENLSDIQSILIAMDASKNVIKPKVQNTCAARINFMPARFVLDNEIIQEMADYEKRPFPSGLDVMAAFGNRTATDILVNDLHEDKAWDKFLPNLEKMKAKYSNYENWDVSIYAKWIQSLTAILKPDKQYPSFMQLPSWNKKNLNTALASWAELKHDAVLYAEQPMAAECGGGGECDPPPSPQVVGYVEPNLNYWKTALEMLDLTDRLLEKHGLMKNFKYKQERLRDICTFLLAVSEKELKGVKLTEQEYNTIEKIGSSIDYITLSIMGVDSWSLVSGPDKEVAVVADIYTNNLGDKAGILHVAVGYANDLYVMVEIEGYLYLVKGATFSYYEFPTPLDKRMTDEEWQEMLKKGKVYPIPSWMKEVIVPLDNDKLPEPQEYIYSSGC